MKHFAPAPPVPQCIYRPLTADELLSLESPPSQPAPSPAPSPSPSPSLTIKPAPQPSPSPEWMPGATVTPAPPPAPSPAPAPAPAVPVATSPKPAPLPNLGHPADEEAVWKICPGEAPVLVWWKIQAPTTAKTPARPGSPPTPAVSALYSLSTSLAPKVSIGVNPDGFGITGLESYFWVAGYDGAPAYSHVQATDPSTGALATLALRATPINYTWSFGDGNGAQTTSPGVAYPAVSSIRNTYDVRSDWSRLAVNGFYQVRLTATFDVAFQAVVPGAPPSASGWVDFAEFGLGPITTTTERDYKVIEIVSVLVGP